MTFGKASKETRMNYDFKELASLDVSGIDVFSLFF